PGREQGHGHIPDPDIVQVDNARYLLLSDQRTEAMEPDEERENLVVVPRDEEGGSADLEQDVGRGDARRGRAVRQKEGDEDEGEPEIPQRNRREPQTRIENRLLPMAEEERRLHQEGDHSATERKSDEAEKDGAQPMVEEEQ